MTADRPAAVGLICCPRRGATMDTTFFIDFDGTITTVDTTTAMMRAFVDEVHRPEIMSINSLWEQRKLSTRECAEMTFQYFHADLRALESLLWKIEIDEGFPGFLEACRRRGDRVHVLSDGFDVCIRTVFRKFGLDLPFYANTLSYDGRFRVECPHANPECGHCGVCKTALMSRLLPAGHRSVYIGDGYSDVCPAGNADLVFAREPLYTLCKNSGVRAVRFRLFREITAMLTRGLGTDEAGGEG